ERRFHPRGQFESALGKMRRGRGMQRRKPRKCRQLVVYDRVVLHRARSKRIELERLRKVELRQTQEMPDHLRLAEFGKARKILAAKLHADDLSAAPLAGGTRRQVRCAAAFG